MVLMLMERRVRMFRLMQPFLVVMGYLIEGWDYTLVEGIIDWDT